MKALTYIEHGKFALMDKPKPTILDPRDAVVRVTLGSICTSDLHIKHGSVPRAVPGITVGHEMVGVVDEVGSDVTSVKPGDRVTCGQEIGTCAGNLEAESAQESHVHLEVTKAGKYMDPMRLIGK